MPTLIEMKPMLKEMARVARKTRGDVPGLKYIERWDHFYAEKMEVVKCSGLLGKTGLRILDIGTGVGFLPKLIKDQGNEVLATDCDLPVTHDHSFYKEVREALGIECIDDAVMAFTPMKIDGAFDAILATRTVFDRDGGWKMPEWRYWLRDVFDHLTDSGFVYVKTNTGLKSNLPADLHPFFVLDAKHTKAISFKLTKSQIASLIDRLSEDVGERGPDAVSESS